MSAKNFILLAVMAVIVSIPIKLVTGIDNNFVLFLLSYGALFLIGGALNKGSGL